MDMQGFVVLVIVGIVAMFLFFALLAGKYFARGKFEDSDAGFSQAGVSIDYAGRTITLGRRTFPIDKIKGLRWESGYGERGNISKGIIELNDMKYPVHKIDFILPSDAERFVTRVQMALSKVA